MLCLSKSSLSLKSLDSVSASSAEPAVARPAVAGAAGARGEEMVDTELADTDTGLSSAAPGGESGDLTRPSKDPDEHGSITECSVQERRSV